jgi:hypothetical protein
MKKKMKTNNPNNKSTKKNNNLTPIHLVGNPWQELGCKDENDFMEQQKKLFHQVKSFEDKFKESFPFAD